MPKPLVIVESKTKADTIGRFLGRDYTVMASVGHIRDLPRKGLAIDVQNHFQPEYVISPEKSKVVGSLRRALKEADELYLATDEDREGEAIAWHLLEVLKPKSGFPVKRMVFHEITEQAIEEAIAHPRELDMKLVEAQEGRRVLDRLVGYEVSPVLWRRVGGARSAGRVQSVATRLVVERERERMAFRGADYWDLDGRFAARGVAFNARLVELDGSRVATSRDFDPATGALGEGSGAVHLREADARALSTRLSDVGYTVATAESKPFTERPKAPFKTTTMQQEAGNKLRFSAGRTMSVAQGLYERGYITYMRTDSVKLSEQAVVAARAQIVERFGQAYLPPAPRDYANKVKNAQEAHEAIRPSGERFRTPEQVRGELSRDEQALYELIWMRTVASQMPDARGRSLTLRLAGTSSAGEEAIFRASGRTFEFLGFRMAYVDVSEEPESEEGEANLPAVGQGEGVACEGIEALGHSTQPPARYTEASLVKELEDLAIGRPSTYASIINTITNERGYVWKKGNALVPSWTAFAKTQLLERYFSHLVDYDFTATMEEALDEVAAGRAEAEKWLHTFYFGNGTAGLQELVSEENLAKIDMSEVNAIHIAGGGADGEPEIMVRVWNTGESLHRGDEKCPLPADMAPDELTAERAAELLAKGAAGPRELGVDPATGAKVLALNGRFGPFVQLGELEEGSKAKPPRASLFKSMDPDTINLETALKLLSLPRVVGADKDGAEITAQNGRYGPYLRKGTDSRSLESEDQIFDITLEGAEAIFAQPKQRRGQAKPPLAELGPSPDTEKPVRVLDGRFGPYCTDGTTNATIPRGMDPTAITLEEAVELLRERAAKGPAKKKAKKKAVKKTAKKKAAKKPAKKVAKKAAKRPAKRVAPTIEPIDPQPAAS
ncbi:MAG: type I DNA topoisomerase [Acidimicrobiia bacterium]